MISRLASRDSLYDGYDDFMLVSVIIIVASLHAKHTLCDETCKSDVIYTIQ